MKLTIEITMDNAAFGETLEEASREAARIINTKLAAVGEGSIPLSDSFVLRDLNGNTVGHIEVTPNFWTYPSRRSD